MTDSSATSEPDTATIAEPSDRFREKRDRILDAAARIINERGLKALTFVAVADEVGLNTTSVTYYFKRKELLAAAALDRSMDQLAGMLQRAAQEATPRDRVRVLVRLYIEHMANTRLGRERPMTLLSDLRATENVIRGRLMDTFVERISGPTARLFDPGPGSEGPMLNRARAHVLLDTLFWMRAWLPKYSVGDYERIGLRTMDLLTRGFIPEGTPWTTSPPPPAPDTAATAEISRETYLRVATRLINDRGYRGASVERIAAELNVSKGSFYHHIDGKDDLVLECFQRSYGRFSQSQRRCIELPGSHLDRLTACMAELLDVQFGKTYPLLRITALQALPTELRLQVLARSDRMAIRFAGIISDGIAEGSIRAVDPLIASQCVTGIINSAYDMRHWADQLPTRQRAIELYAHPLAFGLFTPL